MTVQEGSINSPALVGQWALQVHRFAVWGQRGMVKTRREAEAIGLIELLVALLSACDVRVPAIFILAAEIEREAVARQPGMQLVRRGTKSGERSPAGRVRLCL